jgi:two-component system, OmpR family, phosphate regulon sensor histidine kinase PhoR
MTRRRLPTHQKLFLSYVLLVAAVVLALTVGVDATLRRPLTEQARHDLLRELALGRELYDAATGLDPDNLARRMAAITGHRVTIIAPDGQVVGESDLPPGRLDLLEGHGQRREVLDAMEQGSGSDVRRSASVDRDLLYAAVVSRRGEVIRFAMDLTRIDQAVARVRRQVVEVGGIAILLAFVFSLVFSLAATRRLRAMQGVAVAMAGGDLGARVRARPGDELGDLGVTLDKLATELQRRLGQLEQEREEMRALIDAMAEGVLAVGPDGRLRRANPAARRMFGLGDDVEGLEPEAILRRKAFLELVRTALGGEPAPATELTHDGQHLLATAQPLPSGGAVLVFLDTSELRRLEGVRRDFVANASHELKTPLTAIRGYSETLLDEDTPPDVRRQFTKTLHANATRLQHILDDLLDLSRIESGGWPLERSPLAIEAVALEAWEPYAHAAEERGIPLRLRLAADADRVTADREGLRQVFSNLFSNALRYTPDGGTVEVASSPATGDRVEVRVQDTGSGIPAEHLSRVFERFYRVDPARSRAEGGTGLGLAIVRHLVERHGGRVVAESEPGQGTTIRFTLPTA